MNTIVRPKLSRNQSNELLNALEAAGLVSALAQKVVDSKDNDLAKKVVQLIQGGGFEAPMSQTRARAIGIPVFGIEEAIKYFRVNPSKQQLAYLAEIPWSEEVLQSVKDTHILVAVFPMSILDIRGHYRDQRLFYSQDWYNKEVFAKDRGEVGWQLVRNVPVSGSMSKNWSEQQALLDNDEETPTARMMVYTIIGHFLATGERLFENTYVRCADRDSDGPRVFVGGFVSVGLDVSRWWGDDRRSSSLGLSGARKQ
jgi:hypothetical protein